VTVPGRIGRKRPVEVPSRMFVHLHEEIVRAKPLDFAFSFPLTIQRVDAIAENAVQAVYNIRHPVVPCLAVVRIRPVDRPRRIVRVQPGDLERNERVEDEVPGTEGVELAKGVELAVRDVGERHVRLLVVCDETLDPDVVGPHIHDHDERVRIEEKALILRPVVHDVILDEPGLLAARDVGLAVEGSESFRTDCTADGVVPDLVVPVEA
jgi:hypothetical protein